jgi:hypothetical protein
MPVEAIMFRTTKLITLGITVVALCVPLIMFGDALFKGQDAWAFASNQGFGDWLWFIMLDAMMLGMYYFVPAFIEHEEEITEDFAGLDRDHDGYISREDAANWKSLASSFEKFDADHDGKLSQVEFETFEHALPLAHTVA